MRGDVDAERRKQRVRNVEPHGTHNRKHSVARVVQSIVDGEKFQILHSSGGESVPHRIVAIRLSMTSSPPV